MFWESSGVVGIDLGPLLEGQMRTYLKVLITRLLLVLEVLVHCLYGGYNLHRFSDALGLVLCIYTLYCYPYISLFTTNLCVSGPSFTKPPYP